jgi:hypothetical protein
VFRLGLPRAARARLEIFDVRGRLVATPLDRALPPGWHDVKWTRVDSRGKGVASGVYMARLQSLGETRIRKVALIR